MHIEKIGSKDFISSISQQYPSLIIFRKNTNDNEKKMKEINKNINSLIEDMPKVHFYEYIIDENVKNQELADIIEIPEQLSVVLFKNSCFSRYQINPHQIKNLRKIWNAAKNKHKTALISDDNNELNYE